MRDVVFSHDWSAEELVAALDALEHLSRSVWREYEPDIIERLTWRLHTEDFWTGSEALVVVTFLQDAKDAIRLDLGR